MQSTALAADTWSTPRRWAALLLPFAYFVPTRLTTTRLIFGWLLGYAVPVFGLSIVANGGTDGLAATLLAMVAVYAAYEFGYLVNDVFVVEREKSPTLRLSAADCVWMRQRWAHALVARSLLGLACVLAVLQRGGALAPVMAVGWIALWPSFALYNHWRGLATIPLYLLLTALRFLLPVVAAVEPGNLLPAWPLLLLLYPVPNAYVAAWKSRYGLDALKSPFGSEARFRLCWRCALAVLALLWAAFSQEPEAWVFVAFCTYYLFLRVSATLIPRR